MPKRGSPPNSRLHLKAGELVEVRSREEILATLDDRGRLENLPFMPEMLAYCGRRFRVYKRADKTCDNIGDWSIRRLNDAVFLDGVRCNGADHGGCEAGCLIFWKEAWLKRPDAASPPPDKHPHCSIDALLAAAQSIDSRGKMRYTCQATEVRRFTTYLKIWDPRQYWRDLRSGNLQRRLGNGSAEQRLLECLLGVVTLVRALIIALFNEIQIRRHGRCYPFFAGKLSKTPVESLDLRPGELVHVRSQAEIVATLDRNNCNRGLPFTAEMLPYCGGIYRVARRVHRIVDEKTGFMLHLGTPCIILEGVICTAEFRRLCPRAIFHYWRECWLSRATACPISHSSDVHDECSQTCLPRAAPMTEPMAAE